MDVDGCQSTPDCSALITTVVKNIPDAVKDAVVKAAKGDKLPANPGFVGTLANNGVSIAPYHDFDSKVPAELKAEVDKIKADIAAGTITVTSKAQPTSDNRPAASGAIIGSGRPGDTVRPIGRSGSAGDSAGSGRPIAHHGRAGDRGPAGSTAARLHHRSHSRRLR